jgi:hypothetical protein
MRFFVLRMPTNVPPRQPFRHLEDTIMIAINTDIIIANIGVDIGKKRLSYLRHERQGDNRSA